MTKEYNKLKELCKKEGCFCPPEHIVYLEEANTNLYLRIWFALNHKKYLRGKK